MQNEIANVPAPFGPSRSKSRLPLLLFGLGTSALGLLAVWWLGQSTEFNIMLFYYAYIFPLGAIIVGAVCGSGYGLGSYLTGVRISKSLLVLVVLLQITVYFIAQYLEYSYILDQASRSQAGLLDMGFWEYFDLATRQFSFQKEHSSEYGDPMGTWGYAFRTLEILGFVLGGLIAPLALKAKSYCEQCQVYMRKKPLFVIPASVPFQKFKRKDREKKQALEQENAVAYETAFRKLEKLRLSVEAGKLNELIEIQKQYAFASESKSISKLPIRIPLSLDYCPICSKGILIATQITRQGNQVKSKSLNTSPVAPSLVKELLAGNKS